ncbi:MAG: fibrobacter succinogenes major paralogous domain-containing protein [Saprospiraceae bacterium]
MAENLNVSTYQNGDTIPQVCYSGWDELTTGAWCYYDNETQNGNVYGKLYNWFAVHDPRGLAPKGWHVPSDAEWTILTDTLGSGEGTKMKSTSGWNDHLGISGNGDNNSGFAGLPGGFRREFFYSFNGVGRSGSWWSSSENNTSSAWYRNLGYNNGSVLRDYGFKRTGLAVRCLRD